jgi:hypothetical protein
VLRLARALRVEGLVGDAGRPRVDAACGRVMGGEELVGDDNEDF